MGCKNCGSREQKAFPAEMTLAFPGIEGINLTPVYLSTQILVCLGCGASEFFTSAQELELLRTGLAAQVREHQGEY